MIRKDPKAKFIIFGIFFTKYKFLSGKIELLEYSKNEYLDLLKKQNDNPVIVCYIKSLNKRWWMYKELFYWENEDLNTTEVKALILEKENKKSRKIKNAIALMEQDEIIQKNKNRVPIPKDVKVLVWQRDEGKCVECGSKEDLEFDHIIPVVRGGSNTFRNIQLLCESCNRSKGASLI